MATDLSTFAVPSNRFDVAQRNAQDLDSVINESATVTTRTGTQRLSLQQALNTITASGALVDRGAWVTATAYARQDWVTDGGNAYLCITAHTSGATFAGDSANWRLLQGALIGETINQPFSDVATAKAATNLVDGNTYYIKGISAPYLYDSAETAADNGYDYISLTSLPGRLRITNEFSSVAIAKAVVDITYVGTKVSTLGYYAGSSAGNADYRVVAAATGTADGGSFIDVDSADAQLQLILLVGTAAPIVRPEWWGAHVDGTNAVTTTAAFESAKTFIQAQPAAAGVLLCEGNYTLTNTPGTEFSLDTQQIKIQGSTRGPSNIALDVGATGIATVIVDARLCDISDIQITSLATTDCVYLRSAQVFTSRNLQTKFGRYGVFHQKGNSANIRNHFAESCDRGYFLQSIGEGDANGCEIHGRATNCEFGFVLAPNSAPTGSGKDPSHNTIDYSTESNTIGISQSGGEYNTLNIYSESNNRVTTQGNSNSNFNTDDSPNIWNVKNPDNTTGIINGFAGGWLTTGLNLYHDGGWGVRRTTVQAFSASASLSGVAVVTYYVTNTSGGTKNMTIAIMGSAPVGHKISIFKSDNTAGLTPVAPVGMTFIGDSSTFGAFVTSGVAKMEAIKIDATQILLMRSSG